MRVITVCQWHQIKRDLTYRLSPGFHFIISHCSVWSQSYFHTDKYLSIKSQTKSIQLKTLVRCALDLSVYWNKTAWYPNTMSSACRVLTSAALPGVTVTTFGLCLRWGYLLRGFIWLRSSDLGRSVLYKRRPLSDHQQHVSPYVSLSDASRSSNGWHKSRTNHFCVIYAEREIGGRPAPSPQGGQATSPAITWPLPTPSRLKSEAPFPLIPTLLSEATASAE